MSKTRLRIVALLAGLTLTALAGPAAASANSTWYVDAKGDFGVALPTGWKITQMVSQGSHAMLDHPDVLAKINCVPPNGTSESLPGTLSILAVKNTSGQTYDQIALQAYQGQKSMPESTPIEGDFDRIDGQPAYRIGATWKTPAGVKVATLEYWFVADGKGYMVIGATVPERYEDIRPLFDAICHSIRTGASSKQPHLVHLPVEGGALVATASAVGSPSAPEPAGPTSSVASLVRSPHGARSIVRHAGLTHPTRRPLAMPPEEALVPAYLAGW